MLVLYIATMKKVDPQMAFFREGISDKAGIELAFFIKICDIGIL